MVRVRVGLVVGLE